MSIYNLSGHKAFNSPRLLHRALFLLKVIGIKEIFKMVICLDNGCSSEKAKLELSLQDFLQPLIWQCENHFLNLLAHRFLWIRIVVFKTAKQTSFIYQGRQ